MAEPGPGSQPGQMDPAVLDAQLAEIRSRLESIAGGAEPVDPEATPPEKSRETD
jgi:hypothetical protein